jgi:hypothetical protein
MTMDPSGSIAVLPRPLPLPSQPLVKNGPHRLQAPSKSGVSFVDDLHDASAKSLVLWVWCLRQVANSSRAGLW